jgi:hypothetical protein
LEEETMIRAISKMLVLFCLFASATEGLDTFTDVHGVSEIAPVHADHEGEFPQDEHGSEEAHHCHLGHCGAVSSSSWYVPQPLRLRSFSNSDQAQLASVFLSEAGDPPRV